MQGFEIAIANFGFDSEEEALESVKTIDDTLKIIPYIFYQPGARLYGTTEIPQSFSCERLFFVRAERHIFRYS